VIESISGIVKLKDPTHLLMDVNGIGFGMDISLKTSEKVPNQGEAAEISTYLHVKEGIMELYGFVDELEKAVFLKLISVSGIGPKIALRILSEITPESLIFQVLEGNVPALTGLKGIGKKTAEVMIASLRTPFSKLKVENQTPVKVGHTHSKVLSDAVRALVVLGVKENTAQKAVEKALQQQSGRSDTNKIISMALKHL
jgi:Holliday junction DNA helicase RuvA